MNGLNQTFLLGAATAAHQVEGNNIYSDFWAQEQMENSNFAEPSRDACDHYNRYEEDILLLKEAGLNAYRFSIEWARIEPEKGRFDDKEIQHYRDVIKFCRKNGVEPIVTLHHFSSPKWLITEGGWESENTVRYFAGYCRYIAEKLGDLLTYVCTINEANMGLQMAAISRRFMKQMGINIQVGVNLPMQEKQKAIREESAKVFGVDASKGIHTFLSQRTPHGDLLIILAHEAARDAMKAVCPHLKIGLTLSLHDYQPADESAETSEKIRKEWEEEFLHYLPYIVKDDFIGLQNYTREIIGPDGVQKAPEGAILTQMNYEYYPQGLEHVIRKVAEEFKGDIIVTENGIAAEDDACRMSFIETAVKGVKSCIEDGIPVKGYMYWSLMDNFEWQKGFTMKFGLISVDRSNQKRTPKASLQFLGEQYGKIGIEGRN